MTEEGAPPPSITIAQFLLFATAVIVVIRAVTDYFSAPEDGTALAFLAGMLAVVGTVLWMAFAVRRHSHAARVVLVFFVVIGWTSLIALFARTGHSGFLAAADLVIITFATVASATLWSPDAGPWFKHGHTA